MIDYVQHRGGRLGFFFNPVIGDKVIIRGAAIDGHEEPVEGARVLILPDIPYDGTEIHIEIGKPGMESYSFVTVHPSARNIVTHADRLRGAPEVPNNARIGREHFFYSWTPDLPNWGIHAGQVVVRIQSAPSQRMFFAHYQIYVAPGYGFDLYDI